MTSLCGTGLCSAAEPIPVRFEAGQNRPSLRARIYFSCRMIQSWINELQLVSVIDQFTDINVTHQGGRPQAARLPVRFSKQKRKGWSLRVRGQRCLLVFHRPSGSLRSSHLEVKVRGEVSCRNMSRGSDPTSCSLRRSDEVLESSRTSLVMF